LFFHKFRRSNDRGCSQLHCFDAATIVQTLDNHFLHFLLKEFLLCASGGLFSRQTSEIFGLFTRYTAARQARVNAK
jgi:hypothetical protein